MSLELIAEACKKLQDDKDPLPSAFRKATAGDLALPSRSLAFPVELKKERACFMRPGCIILMLPSVEKDLGLPYNSSHGN
jgi:hypothetical protein